MMIATERGRPEGAPRVAPIDTMVLGATGLIGRWLLLELLGQGRSVAAAVRGEESRAVRLRQWVRDHGGDDTALTMVDADITHEGLGIADDEATLGSVTDVFNVAGRFQFGMAPDEARLVNVDGTLNVLRWAARRPHLRRLIHLSGYRVSKPDSRYPWSTSESSELYRRFGSYEASKIEADAALRAAAAQASIPLTLVNPSTVIGHSATGEGEQYIGLAATVRDLWNGKLPALAGTKHTFVPVVAVDYLARFLAAVPQHDQGPFEAHWVLDERTPYLADLVKLLAEHLGVPAPRRILPVGLIRRLPRAVTRVDPETLSFLSEDRYDTTSAQRLADAAGLHRSPVEEVAVQWAERLVADRFGAAPSALPGRFARIADGRTFLAGDRATPDYVLLHGLPFDAESWQGLLPHLSGSVLLADLPGLGRSSPIEATPAQWLSDLLSRVRSRPILIAHSAASAPVLRHAVAHPDQVSAVVLISPYFLQRRADWNMRTVPIAAAMLRRASASQLENALLGPATADPHKAVASAAAQLRRPGVARRTAHWLHDAQRNEERSQLRELMRTCAVPIHLIVGDQDPLEQQYGPTDITTIPAAGHYPHLSHPALVGAAIKTFSYQVGTAAG